MTVVSGGRRFVLVKGYLPHLCPGVRCAVCSWINLKTSRVRSA